MTTIPTVVTFLSIQAPCQLGVDTVSRTRERDKLDSGGLKSLRSFAEGGFKPNIFGIVADWDEEIFSYKSSARLRYTADEGGAKREGRGCVRFSELYFRRAPPGLIRFCNFHIYRALSEGFCDITKSIILKFRKWIGVALHAHFGLCVEIRTRCAIVELRI